MDEELLISAQAYAERHNVILRERLGFGIHGIVFVAERKEKHKRSAVKLHERFESYEREKRVYQRLAAYGVFEIEGFNVPQLLSCDDAFRAIEMTIVKPPFLLDFGGASLDPAPEFSDTTMADWEQEKREQFGSRWDTVKRVIQALKKLEIHLLDVSPSNIVFRERRD